MMSIPILWKHLVLYYNHIYYAEMSRIQEKGYEKEPTKKGSEESCKKEII